MTLIMERGTAVTLGQMSYLQGASQQTKGIDFEETYAAVVKSSLHVLRPANLRSGTRGNLWLNQRRTNLPPPFPHHSTATLSKQQLQRPVLKPNSLRSPQEAATLDEQHAVVGLVVKHKAWDVVDARSHNRLTSSFGRFSSSSPARSCFFSFSFFTFYLFHSRIWFFFLDT